MRTLALLALACCAAPAAARVAPKTSERSLLRAFDSPPRVADATDPKRRVDCAPDPNVKQDVCEQRGCQWTPAHEEDPNVPWCHYKDATGYAVERNINNGYRLKKAQNSANNPFGGDTQDVNFESYKLGAGVRLKIGADDSYAPDVFINRDANIQSGESLFVEAGVNSAGIFVFSVVRQSTNVKIWDTSIGGMLFGKQYIQLATLLPTTRVYGFGEHVHLSLQHTFDRYRTYPMFARDQPPGASSENYMNLYGVHNFYLGLEDDGKAHGVWVMNTNAQEITMGPAPHLIYRAIGGHFEVFFFPGPKPEDVIRQYQEVMHKPYLPAFWSLGFQLCRYGFKDLDDLKATVKRIRDANIPFDVIQADIDYMDRYKDFTVGSNWQGFGDYVKEIRAQGLHVTLLTDPAIQVDYDTFQRGKDQGANFLSWPRADLVQRDIQDQYPMARDTQYMLGVVWPDKHVAFPDFYDDTNATQNWWIDEIKRFQQQVPMDGIWIDMNEPSNFGTNADHPWYYDNPDHPNDLPLFCPRSGDDAKLDVPPYHTQAGYIYGGYDSPLAGNTLCMFTQGNRGKLTLYDAKNIYGLKELIATNAAMAQATSRRGQILTRSTYPTAGHWGSHWLGDNSADWPWLQHSIVGAQEFNMFGIPHVGSDVCGFIGDTNEELCVRWQQLGAFHSFYRNHNDIKSRPQDPPQWPKVAEATRAANNFRYAHLPYLYTLHFAASKNGGTVLRPVFFEFPNDANTHWRGFQFMWGSALLIAPAYNPGMQSVNVYLPPAARWYQLYDQNYGAQVSSGDFPVPWFSSAPVFVRGGSIVPRKEPAITTVATHQNNFRLLVATDTNNAAKGELYWDDGDSLASLNDGEHLHFAFNYSATASGGQLDVLTLKKQNAFLYVSPIDEVEILGYPQAANIASVTVNGRSAELSTQDSGYDSAKQILRLKRPQAGFITLNDLLNVWTVKWSNA